MPQSLRFRGYWLSLFSWLMLTFATPLANAVAESDVGWLRLCSTQGAKWVQVGSAPQHTNDSACVCLSYGLPYQINSDLNTAQPGNSLVSVAYQSVLVISPSSANQPRSPPLV
ncbi:hypothetical protein [Reinekea sp. G2M2-21]|uniref:hypothetical protein n=1 Tax=Reinekea sp. G2M2-21 TaxID=2788942 RepID=UPI0018ABBF74|nr:hypothetical protein [Reinekea sp. G2M2-21]